MIIFILVFLAIVIFDLGFYFGRQYERGAERLARIDREDLRRHLGEER